jgi:MSHA biogenesis protein MshQ
MVSSTQKLSRQKRSSGAAIFALIAALQIVASGLAHAQPGTTLFFDNLNGNLNSWTVSASGGDASIDNATANGGRSLRLRWDTVEINTDPISAAVPGAELSLWIRRGDDSFSEDPDTDEDLVLEYRTASGSWVGIDTFAGDGTPGEILTPTYTLPAGALHANLSIRLTLTQGSGSDDDYWHVDDVRVTETAGPGAQAIHYSFEEASWTGAAGEVFEESGSGFNGTVFGGAQNAQTSPALPTNPGSCFYADFDGVNDYIEVADNAGFDLSSQLTVAAWVYMRTLPSELHTIVSKDWNYKFHVNGAGQIYWWWNDAGGTTRSFATAGSIALNQWHHVAISYQSGSQVIYVNGVSAATASFTGNLRLNDVLLSIGTDWNFISRAFDGFIDEVYVIPQAYSQAELQALRDATHPCATAAAQFTINHDTFGIHCLPETIAVNVIDSTTGTPLINYNAQIQLDTQSGNGTWVLVSGGGSLVDAVADDGLALYDWPLGESQAQFALTYPQGFPVLDIDVYQVSDSGIRDTDAEGAITFSPNGFTVTASPLSNPPPASVSSFSVPQTAATPFAVYLAAYGETPNDPLCGVIETYTGPKNLKFWSSYQNPLTGTRNVDVNGVLVATDEAAAINQPVTFANGQAQVTAKYKDVGSIQLALKDDSTINAELPAGIRGSTASFVSRPADFVLSDIRDGGGTIINPQAVDASGAVFIAAGTDFRATVTALDSEGDPTPNYGREAVPESVRLDVVLVAPSPGQSPAVSAVTGFNAFSGGQSTGTDFRWPEVGVIQLRPAIGDADYLTAGDVVGTDSENVGRFVPAQFAFGFSAPAPIFNTQCTAGSFTYTGEAFDYAIAPVMTATAQNAAGDTTLNYTGSFFKMSTATLQNRVYAAAAGILDTSGVPSPNIDPAVTETGPGIATISFSNSTTLAFSRAAVDAPFSANLSLSIDVFDADAIAAVGNPATFGSAGGISFSSGTDIRFGRLRFINAVGSERVDLPVPLRAEYFNGSAIGFVTNTADTCTDDVSLSFIAYTENLNAGETCARDSGAPGSSGVGCALPAPLAEQFAEPPVPGPGAGNFNLRLAAPGIGNTGSVIIESSVPSWLRYDWNAALPGDENPAGIAAFGLFGGDRSQIYLREVY